MTSLPPVFIIFDHFSDIFKILFHFENFSHYPNIDCSQWLRQGVQGVIDKIFRQKFVV